jgi:DNA-binding MarR family transcriptional regulator
MKDHKDIVIDDLSNLCRLWRKLSLEQVKQSGVTLEQRWILLYLAKYGSVTVGNLADILGTTPSSVTLITKKMEKRDLLKRSRGVPDDRTVTIKITEKGIDLWKEWEEGRKRTFSKYLSTLSESDLKKLHELLSTILDEHSKVEGSESK